MMRQLTAAFELAKLEGIIPALESAHALVALEQLQLNEKIRSSFV